MQRLCLGAGFEAFAADGLFAVVADAEHAFVELLDGLLDFLQEYALSPAEAERERLHVLTRRQVHLVRELGGVEGHVLVHRLARTANYRVSFLFQDGAKALELGLLHACDPL